MHTLESPFLADYAANNAVALALPEGHIVELIFDPFGASTVGVMVDDQFVGVIDLEELVEPN